MLPNTDDLPSKTAQLAAHKPVPFLIVGDFGIPELLIATRSLVASWAAVPKTAVDKHSDPFPPEGEIRLAQKLLVAPPPVMPNSQNIPIGATRWLCLLRERISDVTSCRLKPYQLIPQQLAPHDDSQGIQKQKRAHYQPP